MTSTTDTGSDYDVVVVGAGMAGLTAGATLAARGLRTAIVEKNDWIGGYAHGFAKDGFHWDHGGHIFLAYQLGAQARQVFEALGLDREIDMRPLQQDFRCVLPDEALTIPGDLTAAADVLAARFPADRARIRAVMATMAELIDQVDKYVPAFRVGPRRRFADSVLELGQRPRLGALAARVPGIRRLPFGTLLRYQQRTLAEMLDDHGIADPVLRAYLSSLSAGIGIGPGRLSAVIAGVFFLHSLRTMFLPAGGFGNLAQATGQLFEKAGGELLLGDGVRRIHATGGRVRGVETASGRRLSARAVVSACDARQTFGSMLDAEIVPGDLRRDVLRMDLTPSIFQVHLGIDMDLTPYRAQLERLNFVYESADIDASMGRFPAGDVENAAFFLYVATLHQREMAPAGRHSVKLEAYTTLDVPGIDWERDKERIADSFVRRAERILPGLGQHVVTRELRTPLDLARDTGNSAGAFAGWAFTPELLSRRRPQQLSSVPGLYLAGHWTTPAAGVPWVMVSGYNTANRVADDLRGPGAGR